MFTEVSNGTGAVQIFEKYGKYETKGIGTVRDQDIRQDRVGMPAGATEEPGDGDRGIDPFPVTYRDKVPLIRAEFCETADSPAFRTGT